MFCSKCGAPVPDNAAFCGKCGANLSRNQQFVAAQPQPMQESAVPHQSALSQQSTTVPGQQMTQQMDRQQTAPSGQPQTGTENNAKKVYFPGYKIRSGVFYVAELIYVINRGLVAIILAGIFAAVSYWSLDKANKFFIAGDGENFKKWKNINTVMIVLTWVLPFLIAVIFLAAFDA